MFRAASLLRAAPKQEAPSVTSRIWGFIAENMTKGGGITRKDIYDHFKNDPQVPSIRRLKQHVRTLWRSDRIRAYPNPDGKSFRYLPSPRHIRAIKKGQYPQVRYVGDDLRAFEAAGTKSTTKDTP